MCLLYRLLATIKEQTAVCYDLLYLLHKYTYSTYMIDLLATDAYDCLGVMREARNSHWVIQ